MAELYVNVNGAWKTASNYYVNVNGTWKEGSNLYAKVSSAWKESAAAGGGGGAGLVTSNLVLHLDAGDSNSYSGSGTTWSDISGNNNDFTLINGPTYSSNDGGKFVFDGSNDHARSAINQSFFQFGTDDYSYGGWIKYDSIGIYESLLACGLHTYTGSWQFDVDSSQFRNVFNGASAFNTGYAANNTDTINTWYYLFLVADRSENELKFYVNGSLEATATNSDYGSLDVGNFSGYSTSSDNVMKIAQNRSNSRYIDGEIAQIHVYKGKALTASEVLQNYNADKSTYGY